MKCLITGLLKGRISRWSMCAVLIVLAGVSIAAMQQRQYQLGGAYIGAGGTLTFNTLQIPLDPAGRTAALRVNPISYGADTAGLLAGFGADSVSESIGEVALTKGNTGKWTLMSYGIASGAPPEIKAIIVMAGTVTYLDPDTIEITYTMNIWPAAADASGDGFPDDGIDPAVSIPNLTGVAKRVPLP